MKRLRQVVRQTRRMPLDQPRELLVLVLRRAWTTTEMCDQTRCSSSSDSPSEPPPSPPVACTNACAKRVFLQRLPSEEVE